MELKKSLLTAGVLLGLTISIWSMGVNETFAVDKYAQKAMKQQWGAMAENSGISSEDVGKFLEMQTGANHLKNPPAPGTSYSFSSLGPWIKTIAALFGLGVFFYMIRRKI